MKYTIRNQLRKNYLDIFTFINKCYFSWFWVLVFYMCWCNDTKLAQNTLHNHSVERTSIISTSWWVVDTVPDWIRIKSNQRIRNEEISWLFFKELLFFLKAWKFLLNFDFLPASLRNICIAFLNMNEFFGCKTARHPVSTTSW